jgi:hypothetical protein
VAGVKWGSVVWVEQSHVRHSYLALRQKGMPGLQSLFTITYGSNCSVNIELGVQKACDFEPVISIGGLPQ